ncbi:MetQ/NlpA family ABC transporter substrate-binding protein [Patescibacteria group bacterium]|nr:MetQ/NlpA family ABC transporter substrate-binding protein [Patescibacteria group bacterium]
MIGSNPNGPGPIVAGLLTTEDSPNRLAPLLNLLDITVHVKALDLPAVDASQVARYTRDVDAFQHLALALRFSNPPIILTIMLDQHQFRWAAKASTYPPYTIEELPIAYGYSPLVAGCLAYLQAKGHDIAAFTMLSGGRL